MYEGMDGWDPRPPSSSVLLRSYLSALSVDTFHSSPVGEIGFLTPDGFPRRSHGYQQYNDRHINNVPVLTDSLYRCSSITRKPV